MEGRYVMRISKHKTASTGPAPITISLNLMTNIQAYVENMRPHYAAKDVDHLFVTREGVAFTNASIGKRITSWWKKATGQKITATQVRKMGSSETMDLPIEEQACVQTVMTHRRRTAEEHYQLTKKTRQAVRGAEALQKQLKTADSIATVPPKASESPKASDNQDSPSAKCDLSTEQLADIDIIFGDIIQTNSALTFITVKNRMSEAINLIEHVESSRMVRKVYNRVKYLQGKEFSHNLSTFNFVDEECSSQSSAQASSCSTNTRHKWSRDDEQHLEKAFSSFDKFPGKAMISTILNRNEILSEIRNRNTFTRCYEKVKNIFKKK